MSTPEIIEDLTKKLREGTVGLSVYIGFRIGYYSNQHWFVWLGSEPTLDFDTFAQLETWVEERIEGGEG